MTSLDFRVETARAFDPPVARSIVIVSIDLKRFPWVEIFDGQLFATLETRWNLSCPVIVQDGFMLVRRISYLDARSFSEGGIKEGGGEEGGY